MEKYTLCFISLLLAFSFSSLCNAEEEHRSKRILVTDNYYTIVNKLDNLSKEVETLKLDNTALGQEVTKLKMDNAALGKEVQDLRAAKGVAFHATLTSSTSGGQKQVIFDHVGLNIGGAYNVYHGNFIAPVNGTYLFSIHLCSQSGHGIVFDLMKNGLSVGRIMVGDQEYTSCNSNTYLLELTKSDDVYVTQATDHPAVENSYGEPNFTGVLLNAY